MTQGPVVGSEEEATPWLRHLAAAMLDCALQPSLDRAHAETMLASVVILGEGAVGEWLSLPKARDGFAMRATLVATAAALLDRPDPVEYGKLWRQATLALAFAEEALDLIGVGRSDANSDRISYALGLKASEPPDRLAADMRHYRDEPFDLLTDAHLLVRLVACAWRLARDGESSIPAVAVLLDQDALDVAARVRQPPGWEPPEASKRSESDLRRVIDRFRSLESALLPMADAESPAAALAALERLLPPWLGRTVLPLWWDGDAGLTLHGTSDLAGQRLRLHGGRTLAALALARGELTLQASSVADATMPDAAVNGTVFDRQCAERVGATALAALPICAPEPIAVLLTDADADANDLNIVGIHAGRWLGRFAAFERQWQAAVAEQRGRFTRGMREAVHEISNPLSVIQNYLHLLGTRMVESDPAQEQVRLISEELHRATSLLRTLTHAQPKQAVSGEAHAAGDVNAVLSGVLALAEWSLDPGAPTDVRFTPGNDLPELAIAGQRLHQVLQNLVKNALEAMPAGGVLDVVVDQAVNDRGHRGIEIRVSDTGAGIDPALLGQIFEAGVSVKGEGRGLGLAITRRLVEELGGGISCRSRVGAGTTFVVWLPAG